MKDMNTLKSYFKKILNEIIYNEYIRILNS